MRTRPKVFSVQRFVAEMGKKGHDRDAVMRAARRVGCAKKNRGLGIRDFCEAIRAELQRGGRLA